ncbi:uncharacterized protein LODBEIA_P32260 [Lodderomyces beijingensis]|uniref:DNA repair protein RAD4 n=1 Tax=Lodderomyces beijingensis TaxID=1775926 RepID=A0ABP0ZRW4_9ASCO
MLKESRRQQEDLPNRKKRRTHQTSEGPVKNSVGNSAETREEVIDLISDEASDSDDFEDVSLNVVDQEDSENSDDFEAFHFDLDSQAQAQGQDHNRDLDQDALRKDGNDILTIGIHAEEAPSKKSRVNFISREERSRRVLIHKMYIVLMVAHLLIRNTWCNDKKLGNELKRQFVTSQIAQLIDANNEKKTPAVGSRQLLDGLKKLMLAYSARYRSTSQGLVLKNWHELGIVQDSDVVTRKKFRTLVEHSRGSRDVAVQGFVTLLRALGFNARLVMSLQPPDYTIVTKQGSSEGMNNAGNGGSGGGSGGGVDKQRNAIIEESPFPVFWTEIFDKYKNTWISIDPIALKIVHVCPKRRKSAFEPPMADARNQLLYVVAVDKYGRKLRDVTRRYSFNYNARTIRKRIEFRSDEDKDWYNRLLHASASTHNKEKKNKAHISDIYELKEFHERDLAEGMPQNMQAFKNHPLYALETQLKQNEVIYPKDKSSTCGTFRPKNSSSGVLFDVYKRSSVKTLRSARAWYMRGRVLKVGAVPLKSKAARTEDEEDINLYAEHQTRLYTPPAVENGVIPKNSYGNIDVYTESMIPDACCLVESTHSVPMPMLIRVARLLDVDYAKAIVSFDFTQKGKGPPKAREGGVVILKAHEQAFLLSLAHMIEEESEENRKRVELIALQNWKFFLLKLRVQDRLNRSHGRLHEETKVHEEAIQSDDENLESDLEGGFVTGGDQESHSEGSDIAAIYTSSRNRKNDDNSSGDEKEEEEKEEESDFDGGFIVSDNDESPLPATTHEPSKVVDESLPASTRKTRAKVVHYAQDSSDEDSESENGACPRRPESPVDVPSPSSSSSSLSEADFEDDADDHSSDNLEFEYETE